MSASTKKDIDSFFTAFGNGPFSHRMVVTTTRNWSEHSGDALQGQHQTINKIDLQALEESQIDWAKDQPKNGPYPEQVTGWRDACIDGQHSAQAHKQGDREQVRAD